jgi:hypothetical protein
VREADAKDLIENRMAKGAAGTRREEERKRK